jgi:hypothetical protein
MSVFLRKYGVTLTATTAGSVKVRLSIRTAAGTAFATSADWTPAAGDVKVSKDEGAEANVGTLPVYTNGQWCFVLSAAELTAKSVHVRVDNALVEPTDFTVETFGHAGANYPTVYSGGAAGHPLTGGTGSDQVDAAGGRVKLADVDHTIRSLTINNPTGNALTITASASGIVVTGDTDAGGVPAVDFASATGPGMRVTGSVGIDADLDGDVTGSLLGNVGGGLGGNVAGKVLGGGGGTITGTGVRAVDASGNALATAASLTSGTAALGAQLSGIAGGTNAIHTALAAGTAALSTQLTNLQGGTAALGATLGSVKANTDPFASMISANKFTAAALENAPSGGGGGGGLTTEQAATLAQIKTAVTSKRRT